MFSKSLQMIIIIGAFVIVNICNVNIDIQDVVQNTYICDLKKYVILFNYKCFRYTQHLFYSIIWCTRKPPQKPKPHAGPNQPIAISKHHKQPHSYTVCAWWSPYGNYRTLQCRFTTTTLSGYQIGWSNNALYMFRWCPPKSAQFSCMRILRLVNAYTLQVIIMLLCP